MITATNPHKFGLRTRLTAASLSVALLVAGCSTNGVAAGAAPSAQATQVSSISSDDTFFTDSSVHSISVEYNEDDYEEMLAVFSESGDKEWIEATVTIDGVTYENVGLRLKGNSSLRGVGISTGEEVDTSSSAEELPWLIRLDKYVDGQNHLNRTDFVVRSNNTETSLNEAVALRVLAEAGVVAQDFAFTRFSVNGSDEVLRLVVDLPDDESWVEDVLGSDGLLYKADSSGDYSYRGEDAESYTDVFDQKYGEDDLAPVIEFLDFINNSTDEEFAEHLGEYLDIDAFATYLAAQDLIGNTDDIDGPGNNSYLYYNSETGLMTVVAWDHNLAYGGMGMGQGGGPGQGGTMPQTDDGTMGANPDAAGGMEMPENGELPEGAEPPTDMGFPGTTPSQGDRTGADQEALAQGEVPEGGMGGMGQSNPLVERFTANDEFNALYQDKLEQLTESINDSGSAEQFLDSYAALLMAEASDLVGSDTVTSEADSIRAFLES